MNDLDEILDDNIKGTPSTARPAFITVLCILTWVGAGMFFLFSLYSLFTLKATEELYNGFSLFGDDFDVENMLKWQRFSVYANIVGNLLCLAGAFFMWNLKKVGYYIYLPGQVIPLVISTYVALSLSDIPFVGSFGMIGVVVGAIFPLAFLIMYGLNLRHMR